MSNIEQLDRAAFCRKVADVNQKNETGEWHFLGERPAVVDFFATWCGPCQMLAPVLEELANDYQYRDRIDFYKVDVDREEELAAAFAVRSIPTLLFIPPQGKPQILQGVRSKLELKQTIDRVLLGK